MRHSMLPWLRQQMILKDNSWKVVRLEWVHTSSKRMVLVIRRIAARHLLDDFICPKIYSMSGACSQGHISIQYSGIFSVAPTCADNDAGHASP